MTQPHAAPGEGGAFRARHACARGAALAHADRAPAPSLPFLAGQYQQLLRRMTTIQGELSQAIDLSRSYKRQNQKLVEATRRVKQERDSAQAKVHEQRHELNVTALQRVESERHFDEKVRALRLDLEGRQREAAALEERAKAAAPPDLDVVRAKIAEELETPHAAQIRTLEDELARNREMYYAADRELQLQRTQLAQYTSERQRDVELHKQRHLELETELRRQLDESRAQLEELGADGRLVEAKRELGALHAKASQLEEEVDGAVRERDAAVAARDEATVQRAREGVNTAARLKVAEERAAKFERAAASAASARDATQRALADATDRAQRAEESRHEAVERANDAERRSAEATTRATSQLDAFKRSSAERESALSAQAARLQRNLDEESASLRDERGANEKAIAQLVAELDETRRSGKREISTLRVGRLQLEQRVASEIEAASAREKEIASVTAKARAAERNAKRRDGEVDKLRAELARLKASTALTTTTTATSSAGSSSLPPPPPSSGGTSALAVAERSETERKIRAKAMRYIANLREKVRRPVSRARCAVFSLCASVFVCRSLFGPCFLPSATHVPAAVFPPSLLPSLPPFQPQLSEAEAKQAEALAKEKRRSKRYKSKLVETKRKYAKARRALEHTRREKENLAREHRMRVEQVSCTLCVCVREQDRERACLSPPSTYLAHPLRALRVLRVPQETAAIRSELAGSRKPDDGLHGSTANYIRELTEMTAPVL